jgi:KUP system potassium uptake protein
VPEQTDIHLTFSDKHKPKEAPQGKYLWILSLTALGVVYGDIGTSPLYAIRECFHGPHSIAPTPDNILGVLSLIFWSLVIIISFKYMVFVMRADNKGEGGILSLAALATPIKPSGKTEKKLLIIIGIFGAALLYGEGFITPSISILSAIEGLSLATPFFTPYVVPITIAILVGLFLLQKRGTAGVGKIFGPFNVFWFAVLAALGIAQIARFPQVMFAVNPYYGYELFVNNGWMGFLVLGSVFLVVTGGETLYADLGHFGTRPIRLAWFSFVLPSLLLNYFGQGALLLENPAYENPFYRLAPAWALYPMIALAATATVIASQAVISGAFSLTMQAVQLGLIPRIKILHTSTTEYGQIYLPTVNRILMIGCILVVLGFQTSSNLAAAYGVAVTSTMVITTILFYFVARERWGWGFVPITALCAVFLVIDLAFLGANVNKIPDGGWFPLLLAAVIFTVMMTWKRGRSILQARIQRETQLLEDFVHDIIKNPPVRVPGTAVFMNGNASMTPVAMLHNLEHNKVLHERILFVTVKTRLIPTVDKNERFIFQHIADGFTRIKIYYGYMEDPDIPKVLSNIDRPGFTFDPHDTTYFLGRETVISTERDSGMMRWREKLFSVLSKNATSATSYFCITADSVVEMGEQVEI